MKLEAWGDIINRPAHQSLVDTTKIRSCCIIGIYAFEKKEACCSVGNCQKMHDKGFLVAYKDEKEVSLCKECGLKLIDASYTEQEKIFSKRAILREQQLKLNTFLGQNKDIGNRIRELKQAPYGANWLYRSLINFQKAYPAELLAILKKLTHDHKATLDALDEGDIAPSQWEDIEQLQGLSIFSAYIKEVLIDNLLKPLKELQAVIESSKPIHSLARFCKWADRVDDEFTLAETLVREGRLFFEVANMERLKSIPMSEKSIRVTRSIHWNCDQGIAK